MVWNGWCFLCRCFSQLMTACLTLLKLTCWTSTRSWCLWECPPLHIVFVLFLPDLHCTFELVRGGKLVQLWKRETGRKNIPECNHAATDSRQLINGSLHCISKSAWLLSPSPSELLATHVYMPIWYLCTLVITRLWFEIVIPSLNVLVRSLPCCLKKRIRILGTENLSQTTLTLCFQDTLNTQGFARMLHSK